MGRSKMTRRLGWGAKGVGFIAALCMIHVPAFAQKQGVSERIHKLPPGGPGPRTPDGHPDFSGVWFPNSAGQALNAARLAGEDPLTRIRDHNSILK